MGKELIENDLRPGYPVEDPDQDICVEVEAMTNHKHHIKHLALAQKTAFMSIFPHIIQKIFIIPNVCSFSISSEC